MTAATLSRPRQQALFDELSQALAQVPKGELQQWGLDSVGLLGRVTWRRAKNLGKVFKGVGSWTINEAKSAADAYMGRRLGEHATQSAQRAVDTAYGFSSGVKQSVLSVTEALQNRPKESAPALVVSLLAFLAASGGVDGDGGAPDLDLIFGIDAHRSIFTHSVLAGATIETLLASTATLIGLVHVYLPERHDPIWDAIAHHKDQYLSAAAQGASLGVAYHLFVDTTIEPAAYHDLLGEHSLATHQTIMGANAAAEAIDAGKKKETFRRPARLVPKNG